MIKLVIFSKDRASQLHLLLTSIQKYIPNIFTDISVLYATSNEEYETGYTSLKKEFGNYANLVRETNFCDNTKELSKTDSKFLCYLTDDDIFYRRFPNTLKDIHDVFDDMEIGCLSLRLGRNTVIQNPVTKEQTTCPNYLANYEGKFLIWNKYTIQGHSNYSYNLSVDGHIFRAKTINNIIRPLTFEHPNDFEGKLQNFHTLVSPIMASCEQSVVVGAPVNKVNEMVGNTFGTYFSQSQEDMNKKFLDGKRIKLDKIEFLNVLGTHQEFILPME